MDNENVVADNSNTAEVVVPETTEDGETSQDSQESIEELKSRLAKQEELINNYKIRAEKAEKKAKDTKETKQIESSGNSTTKDLVALMNAKIHDDDVSKVEKWAKFNNISIAEALKTSEMKAILDLSAEQRKIAEATNVGTAKRGNVKVSVETLENNARSGKLPESDDEIQLLLKRKMGLDKK